MIGLTRLAWVLLGDRAFSSRRTRRRPRCTLGGVGGFAGSSLIQPGPRPTPRRIFPALVYETLFSSSTRSSTRKPQMMENDSVSADGLQNYDFLLRPDLAFA